MIISFRERECGGGEKTEHCNGAEREKVRIDKTGKRERKWGQGYTSVSALNMRERCTRMIREEGTEHQQQPVSTIIVPLDFLISLHIEHLINIINFRR